MNRIITFLTLIFLLSNLASQNLPTYKNPSASIDSRVDDLVSRMTLEEKFWQLYMLPFGEGDSLQKYKKGVFGFQFSTSSKSGNSAEQILNYSGNSTALETATQINEAQKFFIENTRLGIPIIPFDEALHGLVREGSVSYPQSIALAATWDTALVSKISEAIAKELKYRGIRQVLSPVINIASDPRWGRTEETYSEDPFLVSEMGVAFIKSFERLGVITTPKHFIANVGEGGRDSYPIHLNERAMRELHFPPFEAAILRAKAWSIMTSYNSYDGTPCTANHWLLKDLLKVEWGFDGFVISDAGATGGANVLHFTTDSYAESTAKSIESGLDVIFQTSYSHYPLFWEAFEKGMISEQAINEAVKRVLFAKFKLGLFENPYVDLNKLSENDKTSELKLAKEAALKSVVLLKNDGDILPLKPGKFKILVMGSDATEGRLGGYSRAGVAASTILEGLQKLNGDKNIIHSMAVDRKPDEYQIIPAANLFHFEGKNLMSGLKASYFNNLTLEGIPALERIDERINFGWTLFSPAQGVVNYDFFSVSWEGVIVTGESEKMEIGLRGDDGYKLYINGKLLIDNWEKRGVELKTVLYDFEKGGKYDIKIEFHESVGSVHLDLIWKKANKISTDILIAEGVEMAKISDLAIIVVGIEEGEFRDRASLGLPGRQVEFIKKTAALGKPVIVVLVGGSAIRVSDFIDDVDAILQVWYPGDMGGQAIAELIFGIANPSGKLPIAIPVDESQLPWTYFHKPTGRGDDYLNLTGKPLFPFGYGLSYSKFEYKNLIVNKKTISNKDSIEVEFEISNLSKLDGEEVAQLYLKDLVASVSRPMYELRGFQRVSLRAGETKKIKFKITPEMLEMLDENMEKVVEPGKFRIMIGASSNDIRLREEFVVVD